MSYKFKCEDCHDTGFIGDGGPGASGNSEYTDCDCQALGSDGVNTNGANLRESKNSLLAAIHFFQLDTYLSNHDDEQCHYCERETAVFVVTTAEDDYDAYCCRCAVEMRRKHIDYYRKAIKGVNAS